MASQIEQQILLSTGGDLDRLRKEIQQRHNAGEQIAAPHEPLLTAAQRAMDRGVTAYSVFSEVVRGHVYAHYLTGQKLQDNWVFFIRLMSQLRA